MSKSLALRHAALRLAARSGSSLDLIASSELIHLLPPSLNEAVGEAQTIVLIGASTPGLVANVVSLSHFKQLTIVERDPTLFPNSLRAASNLNEGKVKIGSEPTDLLVDPLEFDELVAKTKPRDYAALRALGDRVAHLAKDCPLVPDCSADLVIVDSMVNRLARADSERMLSEAFRVLRRGGRLLGICFLADERSPEADVAVDVGAWRAVRFPLELEGSSELASAGFHGMRYHPLAAGPACAYKGVEVRVFMLEASKGKDGDCQDQGHAVIYRGPWSAIYDDDGHRFVRGERTAVCAKTYEVLMRAPYHGEFLSLAPYLEIPLHQAPTFDCAVPALRSPAITKGRVSILEGRQSSGSGTSACC